MKPGRPVRADATVPESLKPLRVAIYVRASSADQNCELQIRDLPLGRGNSIACLDN